MSNARFETWMELLLHVYIAFGHPHLFYTREQVCDFPEVDA